MTYERREETLPALARTLVRLMARHPDEKGLVHCHSYAIQARLREHLEEFGVGTRVRSHDEADRDGQLAAWKRSDDPDVFLSVKTEEALDLEGRPAGGNSSARPRTRTRGTRGSPAAWRTTGGAGTTGPRSEP